MGNVNFYQFVSFRFKIRYNYANRNETKQNELNFTLPRK